MTRALGIPRELYDDVVRQRDQAIEDRRAADARYAALVVELCALKRHETGTIPQQPGLHTLDPYADLGPLTLMAVEEFAANDVELRKFLLQRALAETAVARARHSADDADGLVAALIARGDTA